MLSNIKQLILRTTRQRARHGKAGGGEDLANAGDMRGDISPHELPLDNPAHGEAQRRQDEERERLDGRRGSAD